MGRLKTVLLAGGLAAYYALTSPSSKQLEQKKGYPLPKEIKVVETSLPFETREKDRITANSQGIPERKTELEKIVKTEDIDFSGDFSIKTDRYEFIKDEDWLPSRLIGHTLSLPGKLLFWDWDYAWGQDEHRTRAALSILENNDDLKDITLRLNHNEALYDMVRMFRDDKLSDRNNFFARCLIGVPLSLGDEIWAEFSRGSYYNPLTSTAVCYSNIEGITAHEMGHHRDFQRFDSDWEYMLVRLLPPVMLYQEWQASQNAKDMLSKDDQWQFNRYLMPAFFTYLLGSYYASRKMLQRKAHQKNGNGKEFEKLKSKEKPKIHPIQTLRHLGTINANLYAGMAAYRATGAEMPEVFGYIAFGTAALGTKLLANSILRHVIPYEHEG